MTCQLKNIQDICQNNSLTDNLYQTGLNLLRPSKAHFIYFKRKFSRLFKSEIKTFKDLNRTQTQLVRGDTVKVREKSEIKNTLDDWRKCHGCFFMDEMYNYCGNTYKVLKDVKYFFDETKQKFVKCKDIVILDGLACSGNRTLYPKECDRNCFLFWHVAWLEKIENDSQL